MATYKVPQDVEAEDKLLGPFSFRQFIYLIVAALSIALAYGLSRVYWALAIIPVPITLFFLVLALPLKKDQPMETYLVAVVRFLTKPHIRLWDPEGELGLVEITAPKVKEGPTLKEFSGQEASERLKYLSRIVDTGGWASRGLTSPIDNLNFTDTLVAEAQSANDVLDTDGSVAQNFDTMISKSDTARKQAMIQTMQGTSPQQQPPATAGPLLSAQQLYGMSDSQSPTSMPVTAPITTPPPAISSAVARPMPSLGTRDDTSRVAYSPYPSAIHQKILSPSGPAQPTTPPPEPEKQPQASSDEPLPPDIMRLATSKDLSISTIAREAERLQKKHQEEEGEVVVSLR